MTIGHIATHLALIVKGQAHDTRVVGLAGKTGFLTGIAGIQGIIAIGYQIPYLRSMSTGHIEIQRSTRGAFPPGFSGTQIDMFSGSQARGFHITGQRAIVPRKISRYGTVIRNGLQITGHAGIFTRELSIDY